MARSRAPYETDAVVVRVVPFAETSQVVHAATPEHGLVAAMARGARRPGPDFQGGLALGSIGTARLVKRRGADMELLTRFRQRHDLRGLTADLDRYHTACYVLDLLRAWTRPALANPTLFRAGVTALRAVAGTASSSLSTWAVWFEARAVAATGHRPMLDACVGCGRPAGAGDLFVPASGGLVHASCAPPGPRRTVTTASLEAMRRLYGARLSELAAEPLAPSEVRAIRALHDILIPHLLERRPVTMRSLPRV